MTLKSNILFISDNLLNRNALSRDGYSFITEEARQNFPILRKALLSSQNYHDIYENINSINPEGAKAYFSSSFIREIQEISNDNVRYSIYKGFLEQGTII